MSKQKPLPQHVRSKNLAMLLVLLVMIVLFFGLSMVRIQENSRASEKTTLKLHK